MKTSSNAMDQIGANNIIDPKYPLGDLISFLKYIQPKLLLTGSAETR